MSGFASLPACGRTCCQKCDSSANLLRHQQRRSGWEHMHPLNIAAPEKDFVMLIILTHAWKHARHAARWASRRFGVLASAAGLLSATIPRPRSYFMRVSLFRPPRLLLARLGCTCERVDVLPVPFQSSSSHVSTTTPRTR